MNTHPMMDTTYEFEVWQDGAWQAGGSASTLDEAIAEGDHYAVMYAQDGPVEIRYYERKRLDILAGIG